MLLIGLSHYSLHGQVVVVITLCLLNLLIVKSLGLRLHLDHLVVLFQFISFVWTMQTAKYLIRLGHCFGLLFVHPH